MNSTTVKNKMYLNALKLVFPYDNKVFSRLINPVTNECESQSLWLSYLWNDAPRYLLQTCGLNKSQITKLIEARKEIDLEAEYDLILRENISLISRSDVDYPDLLRRIPNAPEILYLQGEKSLLTNQNIAIVGPRNPSRYGEEIVGKIVADMVPYKLTVVSGLAMGIDSLAHKAAVANALPTIAVLGAGHGSLKSKKHFRLIKELMSNHLIVSEYPFNVEGSKHTFPLRNRIISGLCQATIVIEAKERSGSLITAQLANDQGRGIFAVPGSLFNACSRGTNKYIQKGEATIFIDVETMCETLNFNTQLPLKFKKHSPNFESGGLHKKIYGQLESELHINEIINLAYPNTPSETLQALTELELKGFIKALSGQMWVRL